jgi:hypothetical protein
LKDFFSGLYTRKEEEEEEKKWNRNVVCPDEVLSISFKNLTNNNNSRVRSMKSLSFSSMPIILNLNNRMLHGISQIVN